MSQSPLEEALWNKLLIAARAVSEHAYVPYSNYRVGAAGVTTSGRLVLGCNVENASYGLTLCAECALVSDLVTSGGGRLAGFVCVDGDGAVIMPCGRCRQLLYEHGGGSMQICAPNGVLTLDQVLPQAWGPHNLEG